MVTFTFDPLIIPELNVVFILLQFFQQNSQIVGLFPHIKTSTFQISLLNFLYSIVNCYIMYLMVSIYSYSGILFAVSN